MSPRTKWYGVLVACAMAYATAVCADDRPPSAPDAKAAPAAKTAPARIATTAAEKRDLQLETTQITGNRELPKVMVIVPWKTAEPAALAGRPVNSLVEEVLTPIDRDVMRRTLDYYKLLAETPTAAAGTEQAAQTDTTNQ